MFMCGSADIGMRRKGNAGICCWKSNRESISRLCEDRCKYLEGSIAKKRRLMDHKLVH